MTAAFVIFDRLTALDFVGAYDPITRLDSMGIRSDFDWDLCAFQKSITDGRGLQLSPDRVRPSLDAYDVLVVPGGHGTDALRRDKQFVDWLASAEPVALKTSICTGSLLLGAAGFLDGKRATTHPNAVDDLRPYCAEVGEDRVVDDGNIITARGVSAGIDLGLHVVKRLAGNDAQTRVAKQMDYPYVGE
jgi:transcriptional regulator GlxA family with amidase domain